MPSRHRLHAHGQACAATASGRRQSRGGRLTAAGPDRARPGAAGGLVWGVPRRVREGRRTVRVQGDNTGAQLPGSGVWGGSPGEKGLRMPAICAMHNSSTDLLIRRSRPIVQERLSRALCWADIPELYVPVRRCPAAWQHYWQQRAPADLHCCYNRASALPRPRLTGRCGCRALKVVTGGRQIENAGSTTYRVAYAGAENPGSGFLRGSTGGVRSVCGSLLVSVVRRLGRSG